MNRPWTALVFVLALGCGSTEVGPAAGSGAAGAGGSAGAAGDAGSAGAGGNAGAGGTGGAGAGGAGGAGTGGAGGDGCTVSGDFYPDGSTGIPAPDGCNTCFCEAGQLGCTEIACASGSSCLVARVLSSCCRRYAPASQAGIDADECLLAYPGTEVDGELERRCKDKSPVDCATVRCQNEPPQSRLATEDGAGGCRFADECLQASDCVIASDMRLCCACESPLPRVLLSADACFVEIGTDPSVPASCFSCMSGVACGACPPAAVVGCEIRNSFNLCN